MGIKYKGMIQYGYEAMGSVWVSICRSMGIENVHVGMSTLKYVNMLGMCMM